MNKLAWLSLVLGACTGADSPTSEATSNLELDTGGFDTADESPEFAATAEFSAAGIEADTGVADPIAMPTMPTGAAAHDLLVMWGKFPPDRTATAIRDWSGQLQISRGAMRVGRAVAFEDRTDHLLPRTSVDTVAFASVTRPASDGLALGILDPTPDATEPLTLAYTATSGASLSIDLASLADGPAVLDAGDGFSVVALGARHDDACHGGFMRGRWHAFDDHVGGYLGLVVDRAGAVIGHVRGIYGTRKNGTPVLFGKFIDRDGHFSGILKGTYENGEMHARWLDRAGEHGVMGGRYFTAPVGEKGAFVARWAEAGCAEDPAPAAP